MIIAGLDKLSLIDYPGKLSAIVFTQGCSFRCPFCHNPDLIEVLSAKQAKNAFPETEVFDFLKKRVGKLDGVVITGGEPTLQKDLPDFIRRVKSLGFLVKLDSYGHNTRILENILNEGYVDYVAMDIKHTPQKYTQAMGAPVKIENIIRSVEVIRESGVDYEFRTTCVPTIHEEEDFEVIADWLRGSRRYFLQEYRDTITLDPTLPERTRGQSLDLDKIKESIQDRFEQVEVRR
jgi:pyruvate formate lyase activating enzyme